MQTEGNATDVPPITNGDAKLGTVDTSSAPEKADLTKADGKKTKKRNLWPFIITGSIVVLGIAAYVFKVPTLLMDRYQTTSVTLKVKEGEKFAVEGAVVTVASKTYTTDSTGKATIPEIIAGTYQITITKEGYQDFTGDLSVVRKSDELKVFSLTKEIEKLYTLSGVVTNFVSGEPLVDVQVSLGTTSVTTNAAGEYSFSKLAAGEQSLSFGKTGFNPVTKKETIEDESHTASPTVLSPVGKVLFVSNRSGKRALYQSNYDGTDQGTLVEPVGTTEDFGPKISPSGSLVAFSSTRDAVISSVGGELARLYLVGKDGKNLKKVSDDYAAQVLKWASNSAVFFYTAYSDSNLSVPVNRFYNVQKAELFDLEKTAVNVTFSDASERALYTVTADGVTIMRTVNPLTGERTIISQKVGYINQPTWGDNDTTVTYIHSKPDGSQVRYKLQVSDSSEVEVAATQATTDNTVLSPDGTYGVFVAERDGKKDLYREDSAGKNEKRLTTLGVVGTTVQPTWDATGSYVIFSVFRENETALYIVSAEGGTPQKITDIYNDPSPAGYGF